jgi:alkaline phosphatase
MVGTMGSGDDMMRLRNLFVLAAVSFTLSPIVQAAAQKPDGEMAAKAMPAPKKKAKNVILFIGDGMGISTITAARIYDGQSRGETGEENSLSFERFPNVALVKTYNSNQQVSDSAGTATAMNSGVITRAGVIGIGPAARLGDCAEAKANIVPTLGQIAKANGKGLGIVTTTRITHATPAAIFAHSAQRDWEDDNAIPAAERGKGCTDIAAQLVATPFDIALGGGTGNFFGKDKGGKRLDPAADLPKAWSARTGGTYVTSSAALAATRGSKAPVFGLFTPSHMNFMLDRKADSTEPTLTEMTTAAIEKLKSNKNGYYLMVEGGRIDHGHHAGVAGYALSETQEFSRAIAKALSMVDLKDTLVLVTADHSHVFTIAGYPTRGNPILGLVSHNDERGEPSGKPTLAADGQPYTTLGYQNGPGAVKDQARAAPSTDVKARQQALVPTGDEGGAYGVIETHAGEDVALFATGPGAENARGVIEQRRIFDIIMTATGWTKPKYK